MRRLPHSNSSNSDARRPAAARRCHCARHHAHGVAAGVSARRQRLLIVAAAPQAGASRATGSSSRRGSREASAPRPARPQRPAEEKEEEPEVPEVGWMWQAASGGANGAVPNPSARMTVADLRQDRIKAKKSLGQNFLTDDGILREIVRAAGVRPGDWVLEVGPGTGNLTKHLLAAGAQVVAVEKDDVLHARLAETYAQVPSLRLVHADVLRVDLNAIMREHLASTNNNNTTSTNTTTSTVTGGPSSDSQALTGTAAGAQVEAAAGAAATAAAAQAGAGAPERASTSGHHLPSAPTQPAPACSAEPSSTPTPTSTSTAASTSTSTAASTAASTATAASTSTAALTSTPTVASFKVVANLPYNITTDFLKATMPLGHLISDLHIMLQDEAGQRLVRSQPGDADYRAMSVRVALYSKPKYRFSIPKEKYYPQPGVDGALITFALIPRAPARFHLPSDRAFLSAVDKGFGERRKKLRNSLQPMFGAEQVEAALVQVGKEPTARAQDLGVAQWAALFNLLHEQQLQEHQQALERAPAAASAAAAAEEPAGSEPAGIA